MAQMALPTAKSVAAATPAQYGVRLRQLHHQSLGKVPSGSGQTEGLSAVHGDPDIVQANASRPVGAAPAMLADQSLAAFRCLTAYCGPARMRHLCTFGSAAIRALMPTPASVTGGPMRRGTAAWNHSSSHTSDRVQFGGLLGQIGSDVVVAGLTGPDGPPCPQPRWRVQGPAQWTNGLVCLSTARRVRIHRGKRTRNPLRHREEPTKQRVRILDSDVVQCRRRGGHVMAGELTAPFTMAVAHVCQLAANGVSDGPTEAAAMGTGSVCHEETTFESRESRRGQREPSRATASQGWRLGSPASVME